MSLFGFGRRPKPLQFKYVPRYYDPDKEDLDRRVQQASEEGSPEMAKLRIQQGLRRGYGKHSVDKSKIRRTSNLRLVTIIIVLSTLVYLVLSSNFFLRFVEAITMIEQAQ